MPVSRNSDNKIYLALVFVAHPLKFDPIISASSLIAATVNRPAMASDRWANVSRWSAVSLATATRF